MTEIKCWCEKTVKNVDKTAPLLKKTPALPHFSAQSIARQSLPQAYSAFQPAPILNPFKNSFTDISDFPASLIFNNSIAPLPVTIYIC